MHCRQSGVRSAVGRFSAAATPLGVFIRDLECNSSSTSKVSERSYNRITETFLFILASFMSFQVLALSTIEVILYSFSFVV